MSVSIPFVEVKHAFVHYREQRSPLQSLLGRRTAVHPVLRDISFSLRQGAWVTLFGEGGAGKSSLLRLLAGAVVPSAGTVLVNGKNPSRQRIWAAGYVCAADIDPALATVRETLESFGQTYNIKNLPEVLATVVEELRIDTIMSRPASKISTTERCRLNIARAVLSQAPLILLDDMADELGAREMKNIMNKMFAGRTVIISTRHTRAAEELNLPVLLLHNGSLAHQGTFDDIATTLGCRRIMDIWVEGLRYDLLRKLRANTGVEEVRLLPADQFEGQRLRITLTSSRYLPSVYDLISQTALVRVEELPPSLADIIARLS